MVKKRLFQAKVFLGLIIISVTTYGQQKELSLQECKELARDHNKQLEIANQHRSASTALKKASYTHFFPSFNFTGSYIRMNKPFKLLNDDMLLPVVPISAIDFQSGNVDEGLLFNPNLHADNAGVIFMEDEPLTDDEGNPVFYRYSWLPHDQLSMGSKNNFIFNMGMTQPIYTGGKITAQYQIASQIETIAKHQEELELSEVLYETEQLYWEVYSLQEKLTLAKEYYSLLETMVKDLENLYNEDIISQNELLKARVKFNEANLGRTKARNGLKLSKMALCRMIGLPITSEVMVNDTLWNDYEFDSLDDMLHKAIGNRPELNIASTGVEISESAVKLAQARFLPNIALSANYFMSSPDPYDGFSQQFGRDWNVGVIMQIPVFHWNERRHILNAAKHEKKVQEIKLEDYNELIKLEVNKVFYQISEAREKADIAALSLEQASENLRLAENNFEVGIINATKLMEAQILWREAYSNNIDAKSNLKLQQTKMQKAIGKFND